MILLDENAPFTVTLIDIYFCFFIRDYRFIEGINVSNAPFTVTPAYCLQAAGHIWGGPHAPRFVISMRSVLLPPLHKIKN